MKVYLSENVRRIEENAAKSGVSYLTMMENAGQAAVTEICGRVGVQGKNVIVVVGGGNNGGDGYAVARLLSNEGAFVKVMAISEPISETAKQMRQRFIGAVVDFDASYLYEADIIIDALFGIGLTRKAEGIYEAAINAINASSAYTVSIDIPSGLFADSGQESTCVKADLTVTFISYKLCQLFFPAADFCGETVLSHIGLAADAYKNVDILGEIIPPPVFKKRYRNTHKGTYGTASLIVGSFGMAGAAVLAAKSCLRSGVGIAKVTVPHSIYPIVTACAPEAVCNVYSPDDNADSVAKTAVNAEAVLIGCGLSQGEFQNKLLESVIKNTDKKLIIDADGLNLLSDNIQCIKQSKADIVITPHPGEMARLCKVNTGEIEANRVFYAKTLAMRLSCTVVLKGAITLIANKDGKVYFNLKGNPGMATGGSGDTLAGIIVSLAAQGYSGFEAALAGVYIHSNAGDIASDTKGEISALPSDLIECLPEVFKTLTR